MHFVKNNPLKKRRKIEIKRKRNREKKILGKGREKEHGNLAKIIRANLIMVSRFPYI